MSEDREQLTTGSVGAPRWQGLAVGILAVISLVALGIGWNAAKTAHSAEQAINTQLTVIKQDITQRLAKSEETNAQIQSELNLVADRMKLTQGELSRSRRQTKQIREDYTKQLADVQNSVNSGLATKASADDVKALGGDVNNVKTDLESTKQSFQMARGELGTLIARNHEEIDQLRRLGQRDYFEFTIDKKGARQQVANMTLELRGTDPKKHQFSLALLVDDMRLEKRNRSINEPIYFYTRNSRAPLELVVNQVGKHKVVGYISVPKAGAQQQASGN